MLANLFLSVLYCWSNLMVFNSVFRLDLVCCEIRSIPRLIRFRLRSHWTHSESLQFVVDVCQIQSDMCLCWHLDGDRLSQHLHITHDWSLPYVFHFSYRDEARFLHAGDWMTGESLCLVLQARIKKIMQTDEEIGKVAAAVPVIICILCSHCWWCFLGYFASTCHLVYF